MLSYPVHGVVHMADATITKMGQCSPQYLGTLSGKILSPLVVLSKEETMVAMVISELKSVFKTKHSARKFLTKCHLHVTLTYVLATLTTHPITGP